MIKIPGTDEGVPGDRGGDLRGHQHQRHAALLRRRPTSACRRRTSAAWSAATRRASRSTSTRSRRSSSRASTPRSTSASRRSAAPTCRARPALANARAAYRRFKEIFERRALREAARRRRAGPAPAVGVDRRQEPAVPGDVYVDELVGPDTVNTMPMPTLLAAAEHARGRRRDRATRTRARPRRAGRGRHRPRRRHRQAAARRHRDVRRVRWTSCSTASSSKREAVVTGRPPTIEARPPRRARAARSPSGVAGAADEDVARRIWQQGRHALGAGGQPEVADRLGWLTIADPMREEVDDLEAFAERVQARRASPTSCCSAWAARASRPRSSAGPSATAEAACACTCSTRPTRRGRRRRATRSTSRRRCSSSRRSPAGRSRRSRCSSTSRALQAATASQFVAITDPGSLAARRSPTSTASGARSSTTPTSAGATARCRTSASCRPRSWASTSTALLDGAPGRRAELRELRRADGQLRAVARRRAGRAGARGPRQADLRRRRAARDLRPVGRAADRRDHRQAGQGHPAGRRRAARRAGRLRRRPRVRAPAQRRRARRRATTPRSRRWPSAGHPTITLARRTAPTDLGRIFFFAEFATAVAGWVLGINPFDQPNVQEAKDNTARCSTAGRAAGARATTTPARAARRPGAAALRGDHGLRAPSTRRSTRRCASCARRDPRRAPGRDDVRLRPALPALDRPAPQGRPADRALPAARARRATTTSRSPAPATLRAR